MREYNETFKFNKGLSSIGTRRNSDELTKCYNILPRSNGLRGYEPLTNPLGATPVVAIDWPFPQLFCGKKYNYLCERDKVHTLDGSFVLVRTKSVTAGGVWSFADYQDWGVLGNGVENYTISSNGTLTIDPVLTPTLYLARVFCDYKGQLVWGDVNNVSGNFLSRA